MNDNGYEIKCIPVTHVEDDNLSLFMRLSKNDDQNALIQLHDRYFHRFYKIIFAITKNKEVSEELTSDVFIQIWNGRKKLDHVENPEIYMLISAKNKALAYIKSDKNKVTSIEDITQFDLKFCRTPEDILISNETLAKINKAINKLPPQCKLIFLLIKENNLKYREVAEILGLSQKTVETQMGIALKKLSESFSVNPVKYFFFF